MNDNLSNTLLGILPLIGAVVTYFIVPYMRTSIDAAKLQQYKEWAALAVKAAELLWKETGRGDDKKAYVANFLNRMFNSRTSVITQEQIDILIESAVKQMEDAASAQTVPRQGGNFL